MFIDAQKNIAKIWQINLSGLEKSEEKTAKLVMFSFASCSTCYLFYDMCPVAAQK